jgi:hypothetical protein
MEREKLRQLVELGGGTFLGCDRSVVRFAPAPDSNVVLRLYRNAVRSEIDIALALKDDSEKQRAAMWEVAPV